MCSPHHIPDSAGSWRGIVFAPSYPTRKESICKGQHCLTTSFWRPLFLSVLCPSLCSCSLSHVCMIFLGDGGRTKSYAGRKTIQCICKPGQGRFAAACPLPSPQSCLLSDITLWPNWGSAALQVALLLQVSAPLLVPSPLTQRPIPITASGTPTRIGASI